jgi:hypothetical protein
MTGGFARLTGPVTLAGRAAQSRVVFGPLSAVFAS